jgi:hypothetical protein
MIVSSAFEIPLLLSALGALSFIWTFLFRSMLRTRLGDPFHEFREPFPCVGMKLDLGIT